MKYKNIKSRAMYQRKKILQLNFNRLILKCQSVCFVIDGLVVLIAVYFVWTLITRLGKPDIVVRPLNSGFEHASSMVAKTIINNKSLNINFPLKKFVDIKKALMGLR